MSDGIRALMGEAQERPLDFVISMYCGQMIVTGRVAPSSWWYEITQRAYRHDVDVALQKNRQYRKDPDREEKATELCAPFDAVQDRARNMEFARAKDTDEVTLIEVNIFPAVQTQGTQSGGQSIPVARVPLSTIDLWWIVSGAAIQGHGSTRMGWGFLFPLGN